MTEMKKLFLLYISVVCCLLCSCSEDNIEPWTEKGYAWFSNDKVDFSFKGLKGVGLGDSYLVPIPITIAGKVSDKDRVLDAEVVRQPEDSRTKFEIVKPIIFHAGKLQDSMYVKVTNSEHLNQVHDTISFKILPSADFEPGLEDNVTTNLCLFNGYKQPDWWSDQSYSALSVLGYFTQLKMEVYMAVVGNADDPSGGDYRKWEDIEVVYLSYRLNDYVKEHNIRYPDDDPNSPGQPPVFGMYTY